MGSILTGVAATSAGSAWAIGDTDTSSASTRPLILRWNGTAWTTVPNPSPAGSYLYGVAATSAGTAWAVGRTGSRRQRQDADPALERHRLDAGAQPDPDPTPALVA